MDIAQVAALQAAYERRLPTLDRTISKGDDMFRKSADWDAYLGVGRSAVDIILRGLALCDLQKVRTVLDFGCGHGRTARHLPLLFPDARLFFSDRDESAWSFCARQFPRAEGIPSHEDFAQVELPEDIDVIFVGSLFTHLDWDPSRALWKRLFAALAPNGCLIPTFHGAMHYRRMIDEPRRYNPEGYYNPLIQSYLSTGFGYQTYKHYRSWGQSLTAIGRVIELAAGPEAASARLVGYREAGWAGQDAAIWSKWAEGPTRPSTRPRGPGSAQPRPPTSTRSARGGSRSWKPKMTRGGWMRTRAQAAIDRLARWLR